MKGDVVGILEAAYRPAESEEAWLKELVAAAEPTITRGLGVVGHFYDWSDPQCPRAWGAMGSTTGEIIRPLTAPPPEIIRTFFRVPTTGVTASQHVGRDVWSALPEREILLAPLGVKDVLGLVCSDPVQRGCILQAPIARLFSVPVRLTALFRLIAVHAAAGLRLLRAEPAPPEAVLHPDGRLAHAERAAKDQASRAALQQLAREIDRARGRLRRTDPENAVRIWEGLAEARWSLVDQFESDGRRFVVARRNDVRLAGARVLTTRERHVAAYAAIGHPNKYIAYALGVTASTVATHLAAAKRKLGIRTRAELARYVGSLVAAAQAREAP